MDIIKNIKDIILLKIKVEKLASSLLENEVIFKEDLESIFGERKWKSYEEQKLNVELHYHRVLLHLMTFPV